MPLSPGRFNRRVSIQASTATPDGAGGSAKVWANIATVWACIEPMTGGEAFGQGVQRATQFYRITIRWRAGISPANRLIWNGTPLNIRTSNDMDGIQAELVIMAESGVGEP